MKTIQVKQDPPWVVFLVLLSPFLIMIAIQFISVWYEKVNL